MSRSTHTAYVTFANAAIAVLMALVAIHLFVFHPLGAPASTWVWAGRVFTPLSVFALVRLRRIPASARVNILVSFVAVILTLYAIDGYLAWAVHRREVREGRHLRTLGFTDLRSGEEVIRDLNNEGLDAVQALYPALWPEGREDFRIEGREVFPLSGISNVLSEGGEWATYRSDEHGFNNPRGFYHPGAVDLAILGDSFTHGFCVSADETFVARVRQHYPRTLNLGMGGAGPLTRLAISREYAEVLRVPIVLWVHTQATVARLDQEQHPILRRYLTQPDFRQGLLEMQDSIDEMLRGSGKGGAVRQASEGLRNVLFMPRLRELISRGAAKKVQNTGVAQTGRKESFGSVLESARAGIDNYGGHLIFVYLPTPATDVSDRDEVIAVAREVGLQVIDLSAVFARYPDVMSIYPFREHAHFNAHGYKLVAKSLVEALDTALPSAVKMWLREVR